MPHDVFISHASDDKPTADAVCHALEDAGVRCWIAPRDIRPGEDWKPAIVSAIEDCEVMVLIFSSEANGSSQVETEVDMAFEAGHPIVPLRIEDEEMNARLKYCVGSRHWLDALSEPLEQHIDELVDSVGKMVDGSPSSGASSAAPAQQDGAGAESAADSRPRAPEVREQFGRLLDKEAVRRIARDLEDGNDEARAAFRRAYRAQDDDAQDRLLWLAVREELETVVELMLQETADPNAPMPEGMSPDWAERMERPTLMHEVAYGGSDRIGKLLLEAGARPEGDPDDKSPLSVVVTSDRPDLVRHLLEAGANPNTVEETPTGREHILCKAAGDGTPEVIKLLIEAGADPDRARGFVGIDRTPLHVAAEFGREENLQVLLEAGADPDAQIRAVMLDSENYREEWGGQTPLHAAADKEREVCGRALLEAGADPNIEDDTGQTPRDYVDRGSSVDRLLKEHGGETSGWLF